MPIKHYEPSLRVNRSGKLLSIEVILKRDAISHLEQSKYEYFNTRTLLHVNYLRD